MYLAHLPVHQLQLSQAADNTFNRCHWNLKHASGAEYTPPSVEEEPSGRTLVPAGCQTCQNFSAAKMYAQSFLVCAVCPDS